jgi:hypothetical protein
MCLKLVWGTDISRYRLALLRRAPLGLEPALEPVCTIKSHGHCIHNTRHLAAVYTTQSNGPCTHHQVIYLKVIVCTTRSSHHLARSCSLRMRVRR